MNISTRSSCNVTSCGVPGQREGSVPERRVSSDRRQQSLLYSQGCYVILRHGRISSFSVFVLGMMRLSSCFRRTLWPIMPVGLRLRCVLMVSMLVLHGPNAWAQNTLTSTISNQYRVPPVTPFVDFIQDSGAAPLPGSTIQGISERTFDGVSTYDLSGAIVCSSSDLKYPQFRGTQGFRRSFPATDSSNRAELKLLFAFDDDTLGRIQSYEVTVSSVRFLTIPYDQALSAGVQTGRMEKCSGSRGAASRTVVKPIVADLQFVFQLARPFSEETVQRLRTKFTVDQAKDESAGQRLSLPRKLIALGLVE